MGQQTCRSCGGSGCYYATERIHNPAGGMFQEIQVRKSCLSCGGSGSVYAPDAPAPGGSGHIVVGGGGPRPEATPEEKDQGFASLLALALAGYLGYLAFFRDFQAETWVKWTITLGPAVGLYWFLKKFGRLTRFLRVSTGVAILLVIAYFAFRFFAA